MRSGKNMTRKKKKLSLQQMFERDAGQGLENFDKPPTKVNVFERASKIKTWNMFIHLVEQENITPAEALTVVLKHVKKNWTRLKILKDPQQMEAIANLLKWENKIKRKKLYQSQYLEDFAQMTGYKIPNTFHTFETEMALFRNVFGAKRDKSGKFSLERLEKSYARKKLTGKLFDRVERLQQQKDKGYVLTPLGWKKIQE